MKIQLRPLLFFSITMLAVNCASRHPVPVERTISAQKVCMTIDATNDKALNCMRRHYPNQPGHKSTEEATKNLESCTDTDTHAHLPLEIIGHGMPGHMITGGGRGLGSPKKYVTHLAAGDGYWQPYFRVLGQSSGREGWITFLSCHTGARESGAELLFKVATYLQRPVRARTGFTYCKSDQISFEPGSEWQEVLSDATAPPAKIDPPQRPARTPSGAIRLSSGIERTFTQIRSVEIRNRLVDDSPWIPLPLASILSFVQLIEFDQPEFPGDPLAVETARIRIDFGLLGRREFVVFNDRLLQDTTEFGAVYYTQPGFVTSLQQILSRTDLSR